MTVTLGTTKPSEFSGYDTLPVTFEGPGEKTTYEFLLSKDGKKLLRLTDVDITPEAYTKTLTENAIKRHQQAELMKRINVAGRPWRGAAAPKVTIVVYDDLQCPYCAVLYRALFSDNLKEYGDRVRIIFKDFPLFEIHPWAKRAAIDSNCLAEQSNDAYWDFSDYVHANQKEISGPNRDVNTSLARLDSVALDTGKKHNLEESILRSCLKTQPDMQLNASVKEADSLDVSSTPTLFINGEKVSGALTESELRAEIRAALRLAEEPAMAATVPAPPSTKSEPEPVGDSASSQPPKPGNSAATPAAAK